MAELLIALAGPAVNLVLAAVLAGLLVGWVSRSSHDQTPC